MLTLRKSSNAGYESRNRPSENTRDDHRCQILSALAESKRQDGLLIRPVGTPGYVAPEMYRKISKADYKFPNWFPPDVRIMLSRILDPNPYARISIAKIMASSWFRKDIATHIKFKVKENQGFMRLERYNEGRSETLSVDVEIFEISSSFHLVEVKMSRGDTIEYRKMLKQDLRPALKEIVWAWQGEQQHH
ncbi:CBL-interacting kinase 18-like [Olea europaea subsp. europaea]|uniref:CBL-interacting kinase 18-like n=1 Tax=Olea europaea subsp. europaea TaxID=158383 RepID=A0A8S0P6A9_OLEEU|nr:CBL-interacting kinase 18-like [Olea europaea subsp. europaea]